MSLLEEEARTYEKNLPDYRNNRANRETQRQVEEESLNTFSQGDRTGRDFNVRPVVTDGDGEEPYGHSDFYDDLSELNFVLPPYILPDRPYVTAYFYVDTETPTQMSNDEGYSLDNRKQGYNRV